MQIFVVVLLLASVSTKCSTQPGSSACHTGPRFPILTQLCPTFQTATLPTVVGTLDVGEADR